MVVQGCWFGVGGVDDANGFNRFAWGFPFLFVCIYDT